MLLRELFPDEAGDQPAGEPGQMAQQLRQAALDAITPMLGTNVPFVTMQQVIDRLSSSRFGIVITPALIMQILDPTQVKAIDRIEGDRIYLASPNGANREVDDSQKEKDQEHVSDMAVKQVNAQKNKA